MPEKCPYCGEEIEYGQPHFCSGSWSGWYPPVKTAETCPHCGKPIEKWIDLNGPYNTVGVVEDGEEA